MEWSTHLISGAVAGYIVTGDYKGAIVGGIAGVIPDLDEPKSKFGKVFFPISYPVNALVGHRTLTHSLPFVIVIGFILSLFVPMWAVYGTMVGLLAHIAGDMLTGTVKFFYPLQKSVGIRVPQGTFVLIDRLTRYSLIGVICIFILKKLNVM